jgi:hypothetical protein
MRLCRGEDLALKEGLGRRELMLGAGGLLLAGCATDARDQFLINMASVQPAAAPTSGADIAAGADATNRMTVPVKINGQGPFDFVMVTGANRTVVAAELAAELGLPAAGMAEIHGIVGAESHPTALVARLQADTVLSEDIRAPTLPRDRLGADGLLGVDVLRRRMVTLDFRRNRLRISAPPVQRPDRSTFDLRQDAVGGGGAEFGTPIVVPARFHFGQLIIVASDVAGRPVTAFLDSGSDATVANQRLRQAVRSTEVDQARRGPRQLTPILSATGQVGEGEVGPLPTFRVGGLTMTGLHVVYADLHVFELWRLTNTPSILIGIDIMRQLAALQIDYSARQVIFYPGRTLPHYPGS